VVLDQEHTDNAQLLGIRSRTSVPWPGALSMTATPPLRSMRPSIDSAIPCRSADREKDIGDIRGVTEFTASRTPVRVTSFS